MNLLGAFVFQAVSWAGFVGRGFSRDICLCLLIKWALAPGAQRTKAAGFRDTTCSELS
jgi:hypothetical protein